MQENIEAVPGPKAERIIVKINSVLNKNLGMCSLKEIFQILSGDNTIQINHLTAHDISLFKFAPLTSCGVERSFSRLKNLLQDNRMNFKCDNIKKYIIVQCNDSFFLILCRFMYSTFIHHTMYSLCTFNLKKKKSNYFCIYLHV